MNKLKEIRTQQRLSQSLLSKKANVSLRTLQAYEQGDRDLNKAQAETVYKLAKALNCQMEELIYTQKDLD
nr:MAG TPA: helix-turn-helix domain protein [Caudoviricetes sp.]